MSNEIIYLASATGAGTSEDIDCERFPQRITAYGTHGSDTGALQVKDAAGAYQAVYDNYTGSSAAIALGATRPSVIWSGGTVRVVYTARAAAIAVQASPVLSGGAI